MVTRRRKYEEDCILSLGADSEILPLSPAPPHPQPLSLTRQPPPAVIMLSLAVNSLSFNAPATALTASAAVQLASSISGKS